MATEYENIQVTIRKEPEQMSAEEIVYELKGLTLTGSRSWSLITQLDKLYNQKCRVVKSLEEEIASANTELALLKQAQTELQPPMLEAHEGHVDSTTTITGSDKIMAYCDGIADAANQIRYFVYAYADNDDDADDDS